MVSCHQAFPFFSKVTHFLLNGIFAFSHLMKVASWLQISGTYQGLSKGNHHLQTVPTQSGWEEYQKKNVERVFNRGNLVQSWCCLYIVWYKRNEVNWCYWNNFWVRRFTQLGPLLYNWHKVCWSPHRLQVQLTGNITGVWTPQVPFTSHPCW